MRRGRWPSLALIAAVVLTVAGCARHPLDQPFTARNELTRSLWLAEHGSKLGPRERTDLDDAFQQVKLEIMAEVPGLSAKDSAGLFFRALSGSTAREIIVRGLLIKHDRIAAEVADLVDRETRFKRIDPAELNVDQRIFLDEFAARMARRRDELELLEERRGIVESLGRDP